MSDDDYELTESEQKTVLQGLDPEQEWEVQVNFHDTKREAFESEVTSQAAGRQLFETTQTLGFGPLSVQPGDTIWRLQGAAVPFILRHINEIDTLSLENAICMVQIDWTDVGRASWSLTGDAMYMARNERHTAAFRR
jgi:hypothetical protein